MELGAEVYWTEAVERSKGWETDLVLMTPLDGLYQATMHGGKGCRIWMYVVAFRKEVAFKQQHCC